MEYVAIVHREGRQWLAEFPDAPGCQTCADTEGQLAAAAVEALAGWLEVSLEHGDVPPLPKQRRVAPRGRKLLVVPVAPAIAVAVRIRSARVAKKLSQAMLGGLLDMNQQQVARLERPGCNPTLATLARVAEALGARLDRLVA